MKAALVCLIIVSMAGCVEEAPVALEAETVTVTQTTTATTTVTRTETEQHVPPNILFRENTGTQEVAVTHAPTGTERVHWTQLDVTGCTAPEGFVDTGDAMTICRERVIVTHIPTNHVLFDFTFPPQTPDIQFSMDAAAGQLTVIVAPTGPDVELWSNLWVSGCGAAPSGNVVVDDQVHGCQGNVEVTYPGTSATLFEGKFP